MTVHFVPDGKTKSMSGISHAIDAATTAKGKNAAEKQKTKQVAANQETGGESKNAAKKAAAKAAKKAGVKAGGKPEGGQKPEHQKKPAQAQPAKADACGSDVLANWEKQISEKQFFGGAAPTQADEDVLVQLGSQPIDPTQHPHLFAWHAVAGKYAPNVKKTWPAAQAAVS